MSNEFAATKAKNRISEIIYGILEQEDVYWIDKRYIRWLKVHEHLNDVIDQFIEAGGISNGSSKSAS